MRQFGEFSDDAKAESSSTTQASQLVRCVAALYNKLKFLSPALFSGLIVQCIFISFEPSLLSHWQKALRSLQKLIVLEHAGQQELGKDTGRAGSPVIVHFLQLALAVLGKGS